MSAQGNGNSSSQPEKKMIVAVHGIGDQFNFATVQTVAYRFCDFFGEPKGVPLGSFHAKEMGRQFTMLFQDLPDDTQLKRIGFAEAYWAAIPRKPASDGHTIEESKKWARTIVERLRLQCKDEGPSGLDPKDYEKIKFVLEEMINTLAVLDRLCFIADKAGLFKFDLQAILRDYLGDVQIVAEFADYREEILQQFFNVMRKVSADCDEIYIVAHSEGTVVSFLGLLYALCIHYHLINKPEVKVDPNIAKPEDEGDPNDYSWIDKVRGYMTIGSPIDKHLILWPGLWKDFEVGSGAMAKLKLSERAERLKPEEKIEWRNYYDYGDPIGFELETARQFLSDNGLQEAFEFNANTDDIGFHRYFLPGKAHNDYWEDVPLFNHFIETVVRETPPQSPDNPRQRKEAEKFKKRPNRFRAWLTTTTIPYVIVAALLCLCVYVIYKGVSTAAPPAAEQTLDILRNVLGLSSLLAGVTLMARLPRLAPKRVGLLWGLLAFVALAEVYYVLIPGHGSKLAFLWVLLALAGMLIAIGLISMIHRLSPGVRERLCVIVATVGLVAIWYWLIPVKSVLPWFAELPQVLVGKPLQWLNLNFDPLLVVAVVIAVVVYVLNHIFPRWGLYTLLLPGGLTVLAMVIYRLTKDDHVASGPLWPLALAMAAFLYLWWLSALIFDLAFVWHAYIRSAVAIEHLRKLTGKKTVAERKWPKQSQTPPSAPAAASYTFTPTEDKSGRLVNAK